MCKILSKSCPSCGFALLQMNTEYDSPGIHMQLQLVNKIGDTWHKQHNLLPIRGYIVLIRATIKRDNRNCKII